MCCFRFFVLISFGSLSGAMNYADSNAAFISCVANGENAPFSEPIPGAGKNGVCSSKQLGWIANPVGFNPCMPSENFGCGLDSKKRYGITSIKISGTKTGNLPTELWYLSSLTSFDISNTGIGVPAKALDFLCLKKLTFCNISGTAGNMCASSPAYAKCICCANPGTTSSPSFSPSAFSVLPTAQPTTNPTSLPFSSPSAFSVLPTALPTAQPTSATSGSPSSSIRRTVLGAIVILVVFGSCCFCFCCFYWIRKVCCTAAVVEASILSNNQTPLGFASGTLDAIDAIDSKYIEVRSSRLGSTDIDPNLG
jgi:hypothetical protein